MGVSEIEKVVIDSLGGFLSSLGQKVPPMKSNTNPIKDLGLSSPDGIDWVCDMEELGFNVPKEINPFVIGNGPRTRTIREIAELLRDYQPEASEAKKER